jgi:hypothetical protein
LAGNHEFYKATDQQTHEAIREACKAAGDNVFYMHKTAFEREGVRVCGSCLWSAIPDKEQYPDDYNDIWMHLSDYSRIKIVDGQKIRALEPTDSHRWHLEQLNWLQEEIALVSKDYFPTKNLLHYIYSSYRQSKIINQWLYYLITRHLYCAVKYAKLNLRANVEL